MKQRYRITGLYEKTAAKKKESVSIDYETVDIGPGIVEKYETKYELFWLKEHIFIPTLAGNQQCNQHIVRTVKHDVRLLMVHAYYCGTYAGYLLARKIEKEHDYKYILENHATLLGTRTLEERSKHDNNSKYAGKRYKNY